MVIYLHVLHIQHRGHPGTFGESKNRLGFTPCLSHTLMLRKCVPLERIISVDHFLTNRGPTLSPSASLCFMWEPTRQYHENELTRIDWITLDTQIVRTIAHWESPRAPTSAVGNLILLLLWHIHSVDNLGFILPDRWVDWMILSFTTIYTPRSPLLLHGNTGGAYTSPKRLLLGWGQDLHSWSWKSYGWTLTGMIQVLIYKNDNVWVDRWQCVLLDDFMPSPRVWRDCKTVDEQSHWCDDCGGSF